MNLLFYIFSSLAVVCAIMVIQSKNPVHSVLFLILVFFNSSALLLLLGLDFFALIFLVVYVGAIAVLFLFVIMMLSIKDAESSEKRLRYLPIGGVLAIGFGFLIFLIVDNDFIGAMNVLQYENLNLVEISGASLTPSGYSTWIEWSKLSSTWSNIETVGLYLYTYYFFFFLIASIVLLVAMIGAIVLTMSKKVDRQQQKVFKQNNREFALTVSRFKNRKLSTN